MTELYPALLVDGVRQFFREPIHLSDHEVKVPCHGIRGIPEQDRPDTYNPAVGSHFDPAATNGVRNPGGGGVGGIRDGLLWRKQGAGFRRVEAQMAELNCSCLMAEGCGYGAQTFQSCADS